MAKLSERGYAKVIFESLGEEFILSLINKDVSTNFEACVKREIQVETLQNTVLKVAGIIFCSKYPYSSLTGRLGMG